MAGPPTAHFWTRCSDTLLEGMETIDRPGPRIGTGPKSQRRPKSRRKQGQRGQSWLIVTSGECWNLTRSLMEDSAALSRFGLQSACHGLPRSVRSRMPAIRQGDLAVFYLSDHMAFAAIVGITSTGFEDHSPIWRGERRDELFPHRVTIRPQMLLDEDEYMDARDIAYRLEYIRRWPPEHWALALQGSLHQLPGKDFQLLSDEMTKVMNRRRGSRAV